MCITPVCVQSESLLIIVTSLVMQVMYMYYFLGFKLWADEPNDRRKEMKANNTMLLALDGDVDFEPKALALLVDLMKRNPKVGAACGRIHPMGTGESSMCQAV